MKKTFLLILLMAAIESCSQNPSQKQEQTKGSIGGRCEGCEAVYESPVAFEKLDHVDTLPGFGEPGPDLEIYGVIYKADGKTPAPGVVLYIYQTDQQGNYSNKNNESGWGRRHGYIRGWIKTNEKGEYRVYTQVPASYPNSNNPKHIHPTIKEPDKNEYWIDEFIFSNDPLFQKPSSDHKARGGSGVLNLQVKNGMFTARRDIILGMNVPDYPK